MLHQLNFLSSPPGVVKSGVINPKFSHTHSSSSSSLSSIRTSEGFCLKSYGSISTNDKDTKKVSVKCRQSDYADKQRFNDSASSYASQSPTSSTAAGGFPPRFFVGHSIYKGKAALTVEPRAPEFVSLDSGAFKLIKEGYVLLQFAPSAGVRTYDWNRKQVFSLSVTEIGSLVCLGNRDSCEFFHDPNKGKSDEGKVRKVLKLEPLPDGTGHFFNLSVQNKLMNVEESIYIPVTRAEYTVLVSAFNFLLPYLIGWHAFANSIKPDDANRSTNNANPKYGGDYEWNR